MAYDITYSDPTRLRHHSEMQRPMFKVDPQTGLVPVLHLPTGKIQHLYPVDVREQLNSENPQIQPVEGQTLTQEAKGVDYSSVPLERLREYAQEAGVTFVGKSRAAIEAELNEKGFVPSVEEPSDGDDEE